MFVGGSVEGAEALACGQIGSASGTVTDNEGDSDEFALTVSVLGLAVVDTELQEQFGMDPLAGPVWFGQGGTSALVDLTDNEGAIGFSSDGRIADIDWHLTAVESTEVPEPATLALFGLGILCLGAYGARRNNA